MKRLIPVLVVVTLLAGCSPGVGAAQQSPFRVVRDVPLNGGTSRFDYQSFDRQAHRLYVAHLGAGLTGVVVAGTTGEAPLLDGAERCSLVEWARPIVPADRALIWETARPYFYLSTTCDRRCIIGGYDEPFRAPVARDRLLTRKTAALERKFRQWLPRIPLERATSWAGTFAETEDGLPFIGRHRAQPDTWFALGYGGNGITFSLIAAEIIRAEILGRVDSDAPLFGFDRRQPSRATTNFH